MVRYGVGFPVGDGEDVVGGLSPNEGDAAVDEGADRFGDLP